MTTTIQRCDGCGRINASVHACEGSARIHGGVGPQLAALRSQLEDARALLAVMVTPEEHARVVQERDDLRVQRDALLRLAEGPTP